MALTKGEHELPNLKIEIENDLEEAMDVDEAENNKQNTVVLQGRTKDVEEGEVCENKEDAGVDHRISKTSDAHLKMKIISNRESRIEENPVEFVAESETLEDKHNEVFGPKTKVFGLTPADLQILTEEKLSALYKSLGIKDDESTEKRYRFDALHMRGTQDMSTEDVFAYFKDYNPASIEWINDYSCNVVWINNMLAAKAVIELSRPIKGLEASHFKDPFADVDKNTQDKGRKRLTSEVKGDDVVVMVTEDQDGEVLMVGDEETGEEESPKVKGVVEQKDGISSNASEKNGAVLGLPAVHEDGNSVHVSDINIPIPPGLWRLGKPTPKAKQVLLRFSMKTDRKPARAEKMSDYYKKHGNPNYGGIKGLITKSRKRRFKEKGVGEASLPKGNPWGSLAETWGNIDRRKAMQPGKLELEEEKIRKGKAFDRDGEIPLGFPTTVRVPTQGQRPIQMMPIVSPHIHPKLHMRHISDSVVLRRGSSSDPESEKSSDGEDGPKGSSSAQWRRKIKQPRMRMYADEEEERVERRREQQRREAEVAAAVRRGMDINKIPRNPVIENSREVSSRKRQTGVVDLRSRLRKDHIKPARGSTSTVQTVKRQPRGISSVWNRLANKDIAVSDSDDEGDSDASPSKVDLRASLTKKPFEGDLRSKLNRNKTMKQNSPLRIEIDNDEYYRVTGCDQD